MNTYCSNSHTPVGEVRRREICPFRCKCNECVRKQIQTEHSILLKKKREFQNQMAKSNLKLLNKEIAFNQRKEKHKKEIQKQLDIINFSKNPVKCSICFDSIKNSVITPCNHNCCCFNCANSIDKCPICRIKIKDILKIY